MKRKTKLKFIAVCLIFTFFCNIAVLAVGSSAAGTVGKFSETLSAKLAAATKDEKISAYVFFKDESTSVLTTMKNTHAELFATYTAAKGVTPAAEEKMATATDSQRLEAVDDVKLQQAIEVKRQLYKNHYTTANSAVLEKHCEEADILFVSSYAPMAIVTGTARELKALALDASVTRIDLFENTPLYDTPLSNRSALDEELPIVDLENDNDNRNKNSRANYVRDTLGYSGQGVKIGQLETAIPDVYNTELGLLDIYVNTEFGGYNNDRYWLNHATRVAAIMIGTYGVAPSATLYSASTHMALQQYPAVEWLVSQGVNVINMSANDSGNHLYDTFCAYIDHLAVQHDVHFVTSSGNTPYDNDNSYHVTNPAMAYNAITVGAYDDMGTVPENDSQIYDTQIYDILAPYSRFEDVQDGSDPSRVYKPNLVAMGSNILEDSGTSYAAPQVTGVIAQLCSYDPSLKTKQTSMGAILMASCGRKLAFEVQAGTEIISSGSFKGGDFTEAASIEGTDNQISDKQGAGKLDAYWAYTIVRDGRYWSLTLDSTVTEYTKNVYITSGSNVLTRVGIFWLKRNFVFNEIEPGQLSEPYVTQHALADWDLKIYDPDGEVIESSVSSYNNYEIVQFAPSKSGTYRITLTRYTSDYEQPTNMGIAVW